MGPRASGVIARLARRAAALLMASAALSASAALRAPLHAQELLTLDDALGQARVNNLTLRRSATDVEIARNNNTAGNAGQLPKVDLTASYAGAFNNARQTLSSGDIINRDNAASNNVNSGLGATWTVFDGFRSSTQRDRLRGLQTLAEESYTSDDEQLAAQVVRAYYDVVQQQRVLAVANEGLAVSRARLENVQLKYQVGESSKRDLLQARVDLNADSSAMLRQASTLRNSKTGLNLLMQRAPDADFTVPDTIVVATDLDLETLRKEALTANATIREARSRASLARLDLSTAESGRYPKLGLSLGYNFLMTDAQTGQVINNRTNGLAYGITASMNLFDGFNTSRETENARLGIAAGELAVREAEEQTNADLARAYTSYRNRLELMALEEDNVEIARENLDLAFDRYRVGTLIPVELREAQNAYVSAEGRLVSARYDAKLAETELLRLSGRLKRGSAAD